MTPWGIVCLFVLIILCGAGLLFLLVPTDPWVNKDAEAFDEEEFKTWFGRDA